MSCPVANIFSSLAFLFFVRLHGQPEPLVAASFHILALLSSSVFTANLSCLLSITFSSLRFRSNSLISPPFNLLRLDRFSFSWFSVFLFSHHILSLSFLCSSVSEALFVLSFSFLSESLFVMALRKGTYSRKQ